MPMYAFHLRRADDAPTGFEAFELADDAEALQKAADLLNEHVSCDRIEVWDGDRAVTTRRRE